MITEDSTVTGLDLAPVRSNGPLIEITPTAAEKLQSLIADKGLADVGLRVFVTGGGCSGLQYGMGFEGEGEADDLTFDGGGVRLIVDPVSMSYLEGATIDYDDELMGGGFKINNPQAAHSCGCGHSFRTTPSRAGLEQPNNRWGNQGAACCGS